MNLLRLIFGHNRRNRRMGIPQESPEELVARVAYRYQLAWDSKDQRIIGDLRRQLINLGCQVDGSRVISPYHPDKY